MQFVLYIYIQNACLYVHIHTFPLFQGEKEGIRAKERERERPLKRPGDLYHGTMAHSSFWRNARRASTRNSFRSRFVSIYSISKKSESKKMGKGPSEKRRTKILL